MGNVRIAPALLAHYLPAAYRYGSEELLRAPWMSIRPSMFPQLNGIDDTRSADPRRPGCARRFRDDRSRDGAYPVPPCAALWRPWAARCDVTNPSRCQAPRTAWSRHLAEQAGSGRVG